MRRGKHIPAILGRRAVDILSSTILNDERDNLAAIPFCGYLYANLGLFGIIRIRGRRGHIIGRYLPLSSTLYRNRCSLTLQRRKVGAGYANGVVIGGSSIAYGGGGNIYCSISLKPALNMHIRSGIVVFILHARANNAQYHANLLRNFGFSSLPRLITPNTEHRTRRCSCIITIAYCGIPIIICGIAKSSSVVFPGVISVIIVSGREFILATLAGIQHIVIIFISVN